MESLISLKGSVLITLKLLILSRKVLRKKVLNIEQQKQIFYVNKYCKSDITVGISRQLNTKHKVPSHKSKPMFNLKRFNRGKLCKLISNS